MAALVESMFSVRKTPWHGLGTVVKEAPDSGEALRLAGLDWEVIQSPIFTNHGKVEGWKANVRSTDRQVLGVVTDRYRVVQNTEAFAFTDALLGEGVQYETAGSKEGLASGKVAAGVYHCRRENLPVSGIQQYP